MISAVGKHPADLVGEAGGVRDRKHAPRPRPDRHVDGRVADIVVAAVTERIDQPRRLGVAGEVGRPVARKDPGDAADPRRERLDILMIGRRGEIDRPPLGLRRVDRGDDLVAQRDGVDARIGDVGEPRLQPRLAVGEPRGEFPALQRMLRDELQRGFVEQVGAQQRAIDIDSEWNRGSRGLRSERGHAGPTAAAISRPNRTLSAIPRSSG